VRHRLRFTAVALLLTLPLLPGCSAYRQIATLRTVRFEFAGVSDVRLAGVRIDDLLRFSDLSFTDGARLGVAVASHEMPLDLIAHLDATNPAANTVTARLVDLDWSLFIDDRHAFDGGLAGAVALAPGHTVDVPLSVRFDLFEMGSGTARDLFDLAVAIAGRGAIRKDLRLELRPTIDTPLGPMRYPAPVVVRRLATR
jgi:hypothetical protein